ncbi:MAG: hypothetical protein GC179_14600 [Anaerolineaceae bacterium]|nr:hypothetical protein [Anaerolineaceae bacterium]
MKFVTKRFQQNDIILLIAAILAVALYVLTANGGFPLDDSWIHQVYGRNLAETGMWAFVPGVPSAASTSPMYTVLLAIGYKVGISFKLWTYTLGIVALWVAGMLGGRMTERLLPDQKVVRLYGGLSIIFAWHLVWAAASGMETMLFSMWTIVLLYVGWRELDERSQNARDVVLRGGVFGVAAAFATITRPEGVALAGLIGLISLVVQPQKSWKLFAMWGIGAAIAFLLAISPYFALNLHLTGGLLPDTAAAKQAENAPLLLDSYPTRLMSMLLPLVAGVQIFFVPGVIYLIVQQLRPLRQDKRGLLLIVPVLWSLGLIALYAARLPAYYQHGRYVIPALPAFIVIGVAGTIQLIMVGRKSVAGRVLTRSLAISLLLALAFFFFQGAGVYARDVRIIDEEMVASAHWIKDHIPPDEMLAIHDIGAVGYFAPRPILDLAGLVSPEIIPFILDKDQLWQWLQQRNARYLMAFPDQIPGDDIHDPHLCPVFTTGGQASIQSGGPNMTIYQLTWNGICPNP